MKSPQLTHFLLTAILALLLWNTLGPGGHSVHAASPRQYKVIVFDPTNLENTLNQLGHEGWRFQQVSPAAVNDTTRYVVLERDSQ